MAVKKDKSELSRQRLWQLKRVAEGKCPQCGSLKETKSFLCPKCAKTNAIKRRERDGFKPWKEGSAGRRPIWAGEKKNDA